MEAERKKKNISALETGEKKHSMFLPGPQTLICIQITQHFATTEHVPTLCESEANVLVDLSAIEAQSLAATTPRTLTCH